MIEIDVGTYVFVWFLLGGLMGGIIGYVVRAIGERE